MKNIQLGMVEMVWDEDMQYWSCPINSVLLTEVIVVHEGEVWTGIFYQAGNELLVLNAKSKSAIIKKIDTHLDRLYCALEKFEFGTGCPT